MTNNLRLIIYPQWLAVKILEIVIKIHFHILKLLNICHLYNNTINNLKGIFIS